MSEPSRDKIERTIPARLHQMIGAALRLALALCLAGVLLGCVERGTESDPRGAGDRSAMTDPDLRHDLLAFAIDNLDHLEEFDSQAILSRIVDRLNEWMGLQQLSGDWQPDPIVQTLPARWRELPEVAHLADLTFSQADGSHLQEVVWLRNVALAAQGEEFDDLSRATNLFDWIVRNVQLEASQSSPAQFIRVPGQTLLLGRGDALARAWLFVALARQAQLEVVILGFANPEQSEEVRFWLPALLSEGELYLYDTRLGLPLPGPDGQGVATLSQVVADEQLLRQLDVDSEHPYPVTSDDLQHVVALVDASPQYLSRRMEVFENHLAGAQKLALTIHPQALMQRVGEVPHVTEARVWKLPYEALIERSQLTREQQQAMMQELLPFQMPALWNGRIQHLKGEYTGEESANQFYQIARPRDAEIEAQVPEMQAQMVLKSAKRNASYWLGLVAFERGLYEPAIEHFTKRTLEATPGGPWTYGARYNLARAYEAEGRLEEAIQLYEADNSPQQHGNRIRARRLRQSLAPESTESESNDQPESASPDDTSDDAPDEDTPDGDAPAANEASAADDTAP